MNGNAKGLYGFLRDDESLMEKITFEEFQNRKPGADNSDETIEKVYREYCRLTETCKLN